MKWRPVSGKISILRAKHLRFDIPKDQINLPTRGGGVVLYDNVKVWDAVKKTDSVWAVRS